MLETKFFSTFFLPGTLALIMLGMGLSLTAQDFRNIFTQPKAVITGLICQMLLLPAFAFGVAELCGLRPELQVGLVLIAACPGGATSNLISYLLKGNVALSVSMTTINSFLVIFTIPTIVSIALATFMGESNDLVMPFWETVLNILLITVFPCVLGILIRARNKNFAERLEPKLKVIMPTMLAIAMLAAIFLEKPTGDPISGSDYIKVLPWALLLNLGSMFGGWGIAKALRMDNPKQLTIGLEVGLQNSGLAITVATSASLLNNSELAIPASTYALFSFFTAIAFGLLVNRKEVRLGEVLGGILPGNKKKG